MPIRPVRESQVQSAPKSPNQTGEEQFQVNEHDRRDPKASSLGTSRTKYSFSNPQERIVVNHDNSNGHGAPCSESQEHDCPEVPHSVVNSQIVVAASSGVSDPQFVNEPSVIRDLRTAAARGDTETLERAKRAVRGPPTTSDAAISLERKEGEPTAVFRVRQAVELGNNEVVDQVRKMVGIPQYGTTRPTQDRDSVMFRVDAALTTGEVTRDEIKQFVNPTGLRRLWRQHQKAVVFVIIAALTIVIATMTMAIKSLVKNDKDRMMDEIAAVLKSEEGTIKNSVENWQLDSAKSLGHKICRIRTKGITEDGLDSKGLATEFRMAMQQYKGVPVTRHHGTVDLETVFRVYDYLVGDNNGLRYYSSPVPGRGRSNESTSQVRGGNCVEMARWLASIFEYSAVKTVGVFVYYEDSGRGHAYPAVRVSGINNDNYIKKIIIRQIARRYAKEITEQLEKENDGEKLKKQLAILSGTRETELELSGEVQKNSGNATQQVITERFLERYRKFRMLENLDEQQGIEFEAQTADLMVFLERTITFIDIDKRTAKEMIEVRMGKGMATSEEINRMVGTYIPFELQRRIPGELLNRTVHPLTGIPNERITGIVETCKRDREVPGLGIVTEPKKER